MQTYSRLRFGPEAPLPPKEGVEPTQMHYEFWSEALEATIRYAADVTGIPVIVTENGLATTDDTRRIEYIDRALQGVVNCLRDGLDVRGYTYWSAFDNFEWMEGYRPTFGLIAVDRKTQVRTSNRVPGGSAPLREQMDSTTSDSQDLPRGLENFDLPMPAPPVTYQRKRSLTRPATQI